MYEYNGAVSGDVEWVGSFLFMGFVVSMLAVLMFVEGACVFLWVV